MARPFSDDELQPDAALWWTFRHQSRLGHAFTVLAGLGVWMAAYWLHLSIVGGGVEQAATAGADARAVRRAGGQAASVACWLWFSLATVLGKGGPGLNISLYPTGALVVGPYASALAFVGRLPPETFTTASPVSARFVAVTFGVFAPGFVLSVVVVGGLFLTSVFVLGTFEAWSERHMPEAWHEHLEDARARERK